MLVEPTQSIVRKYPLDSDKKPENFTDYTYYAYDPIHLDDTDYLAVIASWTKKYYFISYYWNTVKI